MLTNYMIDKLFTLNIPLALIVASFIVILITNRMTDKNGLSALIGGYCGLLVGMLYITAMYSITYYTSYLDMIPLIMIIIIILITIIYLSLYFERITKNEISDSYSQFSLISSVLLVIQSFIVMNGLYYKTETNQLFSSSMFSLLCLLNAINVIVVITVGIILRYYSTQG